MTVVYHHTSWENRASIQARGLLRSMSQADANVGSKPHEEPIGAVYLSSVANDQGEGIDIWEVRTEGLNLQPDETTDAPEGEQWFAVYQDVPPSHLRLVERAKR